MARWEKWLFIGGFALLVVVEIGLAIFQQYRSEKAFSNSKEREKDTAANDRRNLNAKIDNLSAQVRALVQHVQVSQKQVPSTREDAPYGLQVILQTNVQQQPTAFTIECDGEIMDGTFFMAGQAVMTGAGYGVQPDKKRFYLSVNSPPFTPESPLVITLLSKTRIRVTKVERAR